MVTSKKFLLASLVSTMMVAAFMFGLMPAYDADTSRAASEDSRISMVDILDSMLSPAANGTDPVLSFLMSVNYSGLAGEATFVSASTAPPKDQRSPSRYSQLTLPINWPPSMSPILR